MAVQHLRGSGGAFKDRVGQKYGRWTVLEVAGRRGKEFLWRCRCACGVERVVTGGTLRSGSKSCGCYNSEVVTRRNKAGAIHGKSNTRTWRSWTSMVQRCTNPADKDYPDWGGRGITVCGRWRVFTAFLEDMGERPARTTLGRIDNDGRYCKENCRWETHQQQSQNRRSSVLLTMGGRTLCMSEWAKERGMGTDVLWRRLAVLGWDAERAITQPVRGRVDNRAR